jgi:PAS domain S-box-containing protein
MTGDERNREVWNKSPPAPGEFEALFNALTEGVVVFDLERRFVHVNEAFTKMMEYSFEELTQLGFPQITPPEFDQIDKERFHEVLHTGKTGPFRKQYIKKSGTVFWVEITAALTTRPDGVQRIWTLIKDIDAEHRQGILVHEQKALLEGYVSLLQATIESTADGILVVNTSGKIEMFNQKFCELWNISDELVESQDRQDEKILSYALTQLKEPQRFLDRVHNVYTKQEVDSFDTIEFKDGRIFERYSKPQWLGHKVIGRVWSFRDTTGRARFENVLKESEERFRALSEATFEAVLIHDDGKILLANKSACDLYGYDASELIGMNALQLIAPEWRNLFLSEIQRGTEAPLELLEMKKNGEKFWAELKPRSIRYRGISARVVAVHDITERKMAEERARQSAEEFRAAFEVAAIGKAQVDPACGRITRANRKFSEITGYSLDELLGMSFLDLNHPDDRIRAYDAFHDLIKGKVSEYSGERRSLRKDGSLIWINVSMAPIRDLDGKVINTIAIVQDITDRRMAEQERDRLLKSEKMAREQATVLAEAGKVLASSLDYEDTLKNVAQIIVSHFADWCMLSLGKEDGSIQAVALAADPSRSELVQKFEGYRTDMAAPEGVPKAIRTKQSLLYSEVSEEELYPGPSGWPRLGTRDPQILETVRALGLKSYMAIPIFVRDKPVGGILIVSANSGHRYDEGDLNLATELARICATAIDNAILYQEAQRSIMVRDDFISIASHELRTPLTPLKLQVQLLKKNLPYPEKLQPGGALSELLSDSEQQVERLTKLVENLLDVSRISAGRLVFSFEEDVDLEKMVTETLKRFNEEIKAAKCSVHFVSNAEVRGYWDSFRIEQVVTNLISNAIKYGRGKPIEVRVEQEGSDAVLIITDHGIGIDPRFQEKLFGRFERIAPVTEFGGLGLGLFICRQIVEGHGGEIKIASVHGKWTTFRVVIPLRRHPKRIDYTRHSS